MTVAVERGLEQIGRFLERTGVRVVALGHMMGPVDAVVYRSTHLDAITLDAGVAVQNHIQQDDTCGVLMVNAGGKTPEQIYAILKSRVYSPLF